MKLMKLMNKKGRAGVALALAASFFKRGLFAISLAFFFLMIPAMPA